MIHDIQYGIAFDSKASARSKDENGFLRVAGCHITKECVNPYYGREIPGWQERNLDPNGIYYGYRSGDELRKAVRTFDGLPLLMGHHVESAEDPQREYRVGSIGNDVTWDAPYLNAELFVTDERAIAAIESGKAKELSCAYMYDPDFTSGEFQGADYDFVMRNIRGNHVAIVPEGRAGNDVVVADEQINPKPTMVQKMRNFFKWGKGAADMSPEEIEQAECAHAQAILDLHRKDAAGNVEDKDDEPEAPAVSDADATQDIIDKLGLTPEQRGVLDKLLASLAGNEAKDEEPEPAPDPKQDPDVKPVSDEEEKAEPLTPDDAVKAAADEEEDEAYKEALKGAADRCGMDAESPEFQKAFAEGVGYGKEKAGKAAPAMDAKSVRETATKHFRAMSAAADATRSVLGNIDALAFDDAADIYGAALRKMGVDITKHGRDAWRSMFEAVKFVSTPASPAMDAAPDGGWTGVFAGLNRIRH